MRNRKRLESINGMRGTAILMVILVHAQEKVAAYFIVMPSEFSQLGDDYESMYIS